MSKGEKSDCLNSRPYRLQNTLQNYAWGTQDENAYIAELLGIDPEPGRTYAELWMGIHPKAPSAIIDPEHGLVSLSSWLSENPQERLSKKGRLATLPYLFKILSAGEALSIQAHPNKLQAERLHKHDSEHYPDDNHKPEIALAIDHLDALLGFISNQAYAELLETSPELNHLIGNKATPEKNLKEGVQKLFHLWENNERSIADTNRQIQQRLSQKHHPDETEQLFLEQFDKRGPEDIGLLFLFLLNRVHLDPGEAVFLAPGVPHAYLSGNIIECMANSDNVVRLGLTNKFCDGKALADILVYDEFVDYGIAPDTQGYVSEYRSPTKEFRVKALDLPEGESELFSSRMSLSMFVITAGEICLHWGGDNQSCTCIFKRGHSFITPANLQEFKIRARHDSKIFFVEIPEQKI